MNQIIEITIKDNIYKIEWGLSEHFEELKGKSFNINEMTAEQIEQNNDLSITAKILLSAIAGAVIQHLIDKGILFDKISNGRFFVVD